MSFWENRDIVSNHILPHLPDETYLTFIATSKYIRETYKNKYLQKNYLLSEVCHVLQVYYFTYITYNIRNGYWMDKLHNVKHVEFMHNVKSFHLLPKTVYSINISGTCLYNTEFLKTIPSHVRELSITANVFHGKMSSIPPHIKKLSFEYFNDNIDFLSSSNITYLDLGKKFNQPIQNLPESIEYLDLSGYWFDQSIDKLPQNIRHLLLGYRFDQKIDHLPTTLKYLTVDREYKYRDDLKILCDSKGITLTLENL